jgi:transposase
MRALKRRLSDIVYHQMISDARAKATGPGGHVGAGSDLLAGLGPPLAMLPQIETDRGKAATS